MNKLFIALALMVIVLPANADGGGPLLLIVNFMLFTYGQVWILFIETLAFQKLFARTKLITVFKWVILANVSSTLVGALLAPLIWAAVFGLLGQSLWDNEIGKALFAFGTWVAGDDSPYPKLAIGVTIAGFIITYFLTVYIEEWVYKRAISKGKLPEIENLLRNCYLINGISYAGIIGLFLYFAEW